MNTYYVKKVTTCDECHGEGVVIHPAWEELYRKNKNPTREEIIEFFMEEYSGDDIPPEEIPCPKCEGRGKILSWVELREALRDIGIDA